MAKGIANGVAAGFLIYAGLVEIVSEEFSRVVESEKSTVDKPFMCLMLFVGALFMGMLAVWS